jgi:hypothetical protein
MNLQEYNRIMLGLGAATAQHLPSDATERLGEASAAYHEAFVAVLRAMHRGDSVRREVLLDTCGQPKVVARVLNQQTDRSRGWLEVDANDCYRIRQDKMHLMGTEVSHEPV